MTDILKKAKELNANRTQGLWTHHPLQQTAVQCGDYWIPQSNADAEFIAFSTEFFSYAIQELERLRDVENLYDHLRAEYAELAYRKGLRDALV